MQRLLKKWETTRTLVPKAEIHLVKENNKLGIIYYGTSTYAGHEADDLLQEQGIYLDEMRIKAFPFGNKVEEFMQTHETVFVIEQNRDAQMKTLLVNEFQLDPKRLISVLNIDGMPITAQYIADEINNHINPQASLRAV